MAVDSISQNYALTVGMHSDNSISSAIYLSHWLRMHLKGEPEGGRSPKGQDGRDNCQIMNDTADFCISSEVTAPSTRHEVLPHGGGVSLKGGP